MDVMTERATLSQSQNISSVYQTVIGMKDIFSVTDNTIPSVLITKENLARSKENFKQRIKMGKNKWSLPDAEHNNNILHMLQTNRQRRGREFRAKSKRRIVTQDSSRSFLPNISGSIPQTAGGISRKKSSKRKSRSVLSNHEVLSQQGVRTHLPKFRKKLSSEVKSKDEQKIIRNIKFWRETTPISRAGIYDNIPQIDKDTAEESRDMIAQEESNVGNSQNPTWSNKFSMENDTQKTQNKFYARHMALRDRLIEFETMHYREAVTRINRYREKLRRPQATRAGKLRQTKEASREMDQRKDKKERQAIEEDDNNNNGGISPPGIRMSPSKEWKPYIAKRHAGDNQQSKKHSVLHKSGGKIDKKQGDKTNSARVPQTTIPSKHRSTNPTPDEDITYPIHIEKLLRDCTPQNIKTSDVDRSTQDRVSTRLKMTTDVATGLPIVEGVNEFKGKMEISNHSKGKSILIDIRQQYNEGQNRNDVDTIQKSEELAEAGNTEDVASGSTRTMLGTKLRLLLQKSSQSERESKTAGGSSQLIEETTIGNNHPKTSGGKRFTQKTSKFYPPGSTRFPNVTKIGSLSMSFQRDGKQEFMMRGIKGEKETFRPKLKDIINKHNNEERLERSQAKVKQNQIRMNDANILMLRKGTQDTEIEKDKADDKPQNLTYKSYLRGKVVFKNASSTVNEIQHRGGLSGLSFARLSTNMKQDGREKQRTTSSVKGPTSREVEYPTIPIAEKRKNGILNKGLNIPVVVEGPVSEKESAKKEKLIQQQKEQLMQARHMLFDPSKLAITSLTAAILNSELALRAPSSSPVDFTRGFQQRIAMTSQGYMQGLDPAGPTMKGSTGRVPYIPMNQADGLSPLLDQGDERQRNSKLPLPKVSDLVDLQRLYEAVRQQNGTAPFYVPTSSIEGIKDLQRKHFHKAQLKRQPFYHYPYPYQNVNNLKQDDGIPLYIVTSAATKVHKPMKFNPKSNTTESMSWKYNYNKGKEKPPVPPPKKEEINLVYNSPFHDKQIKNDQNNQNSIATDKYKGYTGVRGVIVSMSTPSKPLQQIEENYAT
ncbi:uncharacterized protein LOC120343568 [Styela clava]